MLNFKPITLEHKSAVDALTARYPRRICEGSFFDFYIWRGMFDTRVYLDADTLLVHNAAESSYYYPFGEPEAALRLLSDHCEAAGEPLNMDVLTEEQAQTLEQLYPNRFDITPDRRRADYIYASERMITLAGKKLHAKRNYVNRFTSQYEGRWSFETLTRDNLQAVIDYERLWFRNGGPDVQRDSGATVESLRSFEALGADGGILYLDGEIIGFSVGSPITCDIYDIHIEKAESGVAGAYQVLFNEFAKRFCRDYAFINREDDYDIEGLRKAKMSYYPDEILMKYTVRERL